MTKFLLSISILILFTCCVQNPKYALEKFEHILGKEESKTLSKLVVEFESILSEKYPNVTQENAYKKFIIEINNQNWQILDSLSIKEFYYNSSLERQVKYRPDSMWVQENKFYRKYNVYQGTKQIDSFEEFNFLGEPSENKIALLVKKYNKRALFNPEGNYYKALDSIKNEYKVANELFKFKTKWMEANNTLTSVLLTEKTNYNDPIIKRLIVLELF